MTDVGYIICSLIIAGSIVIVSSYFNFKKSNNITKRKILRLTKEIGHALPIIEKKKTKKKAVKKTKKKTIFKTKVIKKVPDKKKILTRK